MIFKSAKKTFFLGLILAFIVGGFLFFTSSVFAQDTFGTQAVEDEIILGSDDIRVTVVRIINVLLGLLGIVALVIVMYGGFIYMTAAGAEDKIATAKKILVNGVIGLVIILSAFAITRFVLNKLIEATGAGTIVTDTLDGDCFDEKSEYYQKYKGTTVCDAMCDLYPSQCCYSENFLVKSITPSTPSIDEETGMYNVVVRALFSKPVSGNAVDVFEIFSTQGGVDTSVNNLFSFSFNDERNLVEAIYTGVLCSDVDYPNEYCIDSGTYKVNVGNVTDEDGNELKTSTDCGEVPKNAEFKTGEREQDYIEFQTPFTAGETQDGYVLMAAIQMIDRANNRRFVFNPFDSGPDGGTVCEIVGSWGLLSSMDGYTGDITSVSLDVPIGGTVVSTDFPIRVADAGTDASIRCGGSVAEETVVEYALYTPTTTLNEASMYAHVTIGGDEVVDIDQNTEIAAWNTVGDYTLGQYDNFIDRTDPEIDLFTIDNRGSGLRLAQGSTYPIDSLMSDDSGNAYGDLKIYKQSEPQSTLKRSVDGPHVLDGSSVDFSMASYGFRVPYSFELDTNYVAELRAHDIDSNEAVDSIIFQVIPDYCEDPDNLEKPECKGSDTGADCKVQADCAEWLKCLDTDTTLCEEGDLQCVCTQWPHITSVTPLDGAEGNWVTIQGLNFGEESGGIGFNYIDNNGDGDYDDSGDGDIRSDVNLAECRNDVWTDTWIIAEVPPVNDTAGVEPSISVRHAATGFTDYTTDDFGPIIGTFNYNGISRPGLCAVQVSEDTQVDLLNGEIHIFSASSTRAIPAVPIVATGKGFGTLGASSELNFNGVKASVSVSSWSNDIITSVVPYVDAGKIAVYVQSSSNEKSNPVGFTVLSLEDLKPPVITAIDPVETTPESYITIVGTNFGNNQGIVMIGGIPSAPLPVYCEKDNWQDNQIIAKIPKTILDTSPTGSETLPVVVIREDNGLRSASSTLGVVTGNPRPSLCYLDPSYGPAPLPTGEVLTLKGENFSSAPGVFFSTDLTDVSNISTWLSTSLGGGDGSGSATEVSNIQIKTSIPHDADNGLAISTGPVKVRSSSGEFSNSMNYEVSDCREPGVGEIAGFQCCTEGNDAGKWKENNFVCEGGTREAGYVWRFTTGKIPDQFYVVESCSESLPSPSPWKEWTQGERACVNAQMLVRFSLPLDETTVGSEIINTNNISIYTCGQGNSSDCDNGNDVTTVFESDIWGSDTFYMEPVSGGLDPNTWYRVAFSSNVKSLRNEFKFGENVTTTEDLLATRPCDVDGDGNDDASYCFEFKTGGADEICTLIGAGMYKDEYTTKMLGVVQDPRWGNLFDINKVFNINDPEMNPLYYFVYGIANQECTVINVDDKPWEWGPGEGVDAVSGHKSISDRYQNSRGVAKAWENNYPDGDEIFATILNENVPEDEPEQSFITHDVLSESGLPTPLVIQSISDAVLIDGDDHQYNWGRASSIEMSITLDTPSLDTPNVWDGKSRYDWILYKNNNNTLKGHADMFVRTEIYTISGQVNKYFSFRIQREGGSWTEARFDLSEDVVNLGIRIENFEMEDDQTNIIVNLVADGVPLESKEFIVDANWDDSGTSRLLIGKHNASMITMGLIGSIDRFVISENVLARQAEGEDTTIPSEIRATSTLIVDLDKPNVIEKWPFCNEACINSEIGALFDQIMDDTTYGSNIKLYECIGGEACLILQERAIGVSVDGSDNSNIRAYSNQYLEKNTWYVVKVLSGIRAIAGVDFNPDGTIKNTRRGKSIEQTKWKFRTKNSEEPCVVDRVNMYPNPFTATYIGQKQQYNALPKGAPDSCNPYGQNLNPWNYGWEWNVEHEYVATTTQFSMSSSFKKACTINCLPGGSDVARSSYTAYPICGNGIVEAGEDCDINAPGEIAGVSCSYICLRPGNREKGSLEGAEANACGNGVVDYAFGEECDFNDTSLVTTTSEGETVDYRPYCSDICLWTGSTREETGDIAKPVCGSTSVTVGEDCDVKDDATKDGCSNECLHIGTPLMQNWCDINDPNITREVCNYATSVCGNGIVELGEVCEVDVDGATTETCNDVCLLYIEDLENNANAICDNPSLKQCNASDEGCTPYCTLAGSSILYSQSSICWDGIAGIGEYAGDVVSQPYLSCEVTPDDARNDLGNNPVQIVTALGLPPQGGDDSSALIDEDGDGIVELQQTLIHASPGTYRNLEGGVSSTSRNPDGSIKIEGSGIYNLQCGYTEYDPAHDPNRVMQEITRQDVIANDDAIFVPFGQADLTFNVLANDHGQGLKITGAGKIFDLTSNEGSDDSGPVDGSSIIDIVYTDSQIEIKIVSTTFQGIVSFAYGVENSDGSDSDEGLSAIMIGQGEENTVIESNPDIVIIEYGGKETIIDVLANDNPLGGLEMIDFVIGDIDPESVNSLEDEVANSSDANIVESISIIEDTDNISKILISFAEDFSGIAGISYDISDGKDIVGESFLVIEVRAPSQQVTEEVEVILSGTGFIEYNDCPTNIGNTFGVATNSCCYRRPERQDQYPEVNQGIGQTEPVCRNTYLEVEFDREMDPTTFADNVSIVQGYQSNIYPNYSCAENGGQDITLAMNTLLGITPGEISQGFWSTLWNKVKSFFARIFTGEVFAADSGVPVNDGLPVDITWCTSDIELDDYMTYDFDEYEGTQTTVSLYINQAFDEDVYVAVMMDGGDTKIRDIEGVGIKDPHSDSRTDYWIFKTGSEICKIDHINVDPDRYLFQTPTSEKDFNAQVVSITGGQSIVPIEGVYDWAWNWQPTNNPVFNIPSGNVPHTHVTTKGVEGHINALVQAEVVEDIFEENNQLGRKFNDTFDLTAFFCANPWPSIYATAGAGASVSTTLGFFEDSAYHYSSFYCADDGNPVSTHDDLPLFDNIVAIDAYADLGIVTGVCAGTTDMCVTSDDCPVTFSAFEHEPQLGGGTFIVRGANPGLCAIVANDGYHNNPYTACSDTEPCGTGDGGVALYCRSGQASAENAARVQCVLNDYQNALKQYFLFSSTTDDVVGVQIFDNQSKPNGDLQTLDEWYIDQFGDIGNMQRASIGNYEALTDGSNVYIHFYDFSRSDSPVDKGEINNYIILLSIDVNSSQQTQKAFEQLINHFQLNTNFTGWGKCLHNTAPDHANGYIPVRTDGNNLSNIDCETDFDCRDEQGALKSGTNGICSNQDAKFFRDINRLKDLRVSQSRLDQYFAGHQD
ncbi:hypothetical protein HOF40_01110, partial [Candidatus Parcubacteria bacterium]|nr:hypothetical protein [Candidatus Parcubacteria bacterium]